MIELKEIEKVGEFKITPLKERNPSHAKYFDFMLKESLMDPKRPKPKVLPVFENEFQKQRAILEMQPESTKKTLLRDEKDDAAHFWRLLPDHAQVKNEFGQLVIGTRSIEIDEINVVQANRSKQKNTFGQSEKSSVDDAKRTKGIEAFVYSKPADLTQEEKAKVTHLVPLESRLLEPEAKRSFWDKLLGKNKPRKAIYDGFGYTFEENKDAK